MAKKRKICITGSEGRIGTILKRGLSAKYQLSLIDKKADPGEFNYSFDIAKNYSKLKKIFKGQDAVIHLAWDLTEDYPNEIIVKENKTMGENVIRAATETGVKKLILASSIHADGYEMSKNKNRLIMPDRIPTPDTPYGASKIYLEMLAKYFSERYGLEVVCIRFGGINPTDELLLDEDPIYARVQLKSEDCIKLVDNAIKTKPIEGKFKVIYGVSNNRRPIYANQ